MRALQVDSLDGPDGLHLVDLPEPSGDGQVLVDVTAAGVSFPDLLLSRGLYQMKPPPPFVPGVEVAGRVRSAPVGSDLAPGDRVAGFCMLGGFAEVVAVPEPLVWRIPGTITDEEAAGFLLNHQTALFALQRRGRLAPGETVVIHGAAGGVGTAAVQIARALGATVVAVTSSDAKAEVARRAGAHQVIDSGGPWAAELKALADGRGADLIVDPVGGDRFDESLRCLAPGGRLVVVGFTEGRIPSVAANRLLLKNIEVVGAAWGAWLGTDPGYFAEANRVLERLIAAGTLRPLVGTALPLAEGAEALRLLERREATGKVVLQVSAG
jgi:NADPH2:quinone reductase